MFLQTDTIIFKSFYFVTNKYTLDNLKYVFQQITVCSQNLILLLWGNFNTVFQDVYSVNDRWRLTICYNTRQFTSQLDLSNQGILPVHVMLVKHYSTSYCLCRIKCETFKGYCKIIGNISDPNTF